LSSTAPGLAPRSKSTRMTSPQPLCALAARAVVPLWFRSSASAPLAAARTSLAAGASPLVLNALSHHAGTLSRHSFGVSSGMKIRVSSSSCTW